MAGTVTTLHTADGVRLAARWWEPASATGDAVVVVHGFAASKDQPAVEAVARHLAAAGHAVLTYDSRGHGESGGLCTLGELERHDVDAAITAAAVHADRVVVVGTSMGGVAVVNHLASATGELANGAGARGAVVVATPARWQIPRTWRGAASVVITQTGAGRGGGARRGPPPRSQCGPTGALRPSNASAWWAGPSRSSTGSQTGSSPRRPRRRCSPPPASPAGSTSSRGWVTVSVPLRSVPSSRP